jgi:hypothetical protein
LIVVFKFLERPNIDLMNGSMIDMRGSRTQSKGKHLQDMMKQSRTSSSLAQSSDDDNMMPSHSFRKFNILVKAFSSHKSRVMTVKQLLAPEIWNTHGTFLFSPNVVHSRS